MSDAVLEAVTRAIEKTSRVVNDYGTPLLDNPEECARAAISIMIEECAKIADAEGLSPNASASYCAAAFHIGMCIRASKSPPGENK